MKKIIISLAALAALTTAGMANDRSEDYTAAYRNVHFGSVDGTKADGAKALSSETRGALAGDVSSFASNKLRGIEHLTLRGSNS